MFCESAYTQGENYQQFWKAINRGETQSGEFLRFNKEGKEIWLKATYTPVLDSDGKPVKVIKFAFDITKEKHRDLDRRAQLEAINISNLKLELTPDGAIIEANPIIMDLLKQEPDMVIGNSFGNLLADDEAMQTQFIADWAKLDRKECFTGTYALKNSTGETVWVAANYSPVVATNGEITKIIIVGQDITERKKLEENLAIQIEQMRAQEEFLQDTMDQLQAQEEELRQNMEEMQAIQEEMESKMAQSDEMAIEMKGRISALDETVTLCELDEQGNISYVNNKFCDVLGYKPDDIVGKFFSQLYHQEVPQSMTKHIWSSVKKGKTFKGRYPYVTKKGVTCWMDTTIVPVMDSQKKAPFKYTIVAFPVEQEDEQTILLQKELEAIKLS
jgi:PAS domain S-box-containing protein